jgi:two-component system cell cycle sensor histidine kinase/response regulator CckA
MPTVLLVENESSILEHLRYALERAGYTVLSATSGESAIRICCAYPSTIHVLVSDVLMSPITGFQVATTVKSRHPKAIVILMSGSPRFTFTERLKANDFLDKPFTHHDLLAAIARYTPIPAQVGGSRETWN